MKRHEVYLGRTKRLIGGEDLPPPMTSKTPWASNNVFKPQFQKTTAFVAAPVEESDSTPVDLGFDALEESTSNADLASEDLSGLYIPYYLGKANNGEWVLTKRMVRAIQADEQQQKHCFVCQSPDHFARNCPPAKNVQRPLQPRGPPKTTTAVYLILGTPTLYRAVQVIKESKITQLAVPWATSCFSYLIRGLQAWVGQEVRTDVGNINIAPTSVDEVVRVSSKFQIPPIGCKAIHGRTGLLLMGYKLNVMTQGLEKKSPQLPLAVEVLSSYATLTMASNRITVVLRNNTNEWVEVQKGVPIARMVTANVIPPVNLSSSPVRTSDSG